MISEQDRLYLRNFRITVVDNCKKCNGGGYLLSSECECTKRYNIEFEKARAGIPYRYRQFDFSYLKNINSKDIPKLKKYLKEIKNYKNNGVGLILSGDYNSGKATVASIILNELINKGYKKCGYLRFPQIMSAIQTYLRSGYMDEHIDHIINNCEFIAIEDVGITTYYEDQMSVLMNNFINMLDKRISFCFPTIITTRDKNQLLDVSNKRMESILDNNFIEVSLKFDEKDKEKRDKDRK